MNNDTAAAIAQTLVGMNSSHFNCLKWFSIESEHFDPFVSTDAKVVYGKRTSL